MSSERSGSNLVRRMLAAHSQVAAPPPPHLLRVLAPLLPHYGPLDRGEGFRALLADALSMTRVERSHLEWRHALTADEVEPRVKKRSLAGIVCALYASYAARESKPRWACKENHLWDFAFRMLDVEPEARIVYLVRDGRDVACSIRNVPTHDQHVYFIAKEWRDEQWRSLAVLQDAGAGGRATLLRYEDLLAEPEPELARLCRFLGLDFEPRMLEFHAEAESRTDAQKTAFWKNLDRPLMRSNRAKYRAELGPRDIAIFESVAGDALELLGYPLERPEKRRSSVRGLRKALYRLQNRHMVARKKRALYDEPGRRERAEAIGSIHRRRVDGERAAHAPLLRYD